MQKLDNFDTNKKIGSLVKTSFVDFPGQVSAALFLHACNLRCPYCYNKDLVTGKIENYNAVSFTEIFDHLQKRKNVLTGFVISGGEPCIFPFLPLLIEKAHDLGFLVKLDTNGTKPEILEQLFLTPKHTPDFIAMDLKTSLENYAQFLPKNAEENSISKKIKNSIKIISKMPKNCSEFRTVLVPTLDDKEKNEKMASLLPKNAIWRFANFSNNGCLNPAFDNLEPFSKKETEELVNFAQTFIKDTKLR